MSSDARAASGAKLPFEWQGVTYHLSPITRNGIARLSAILAGKRMSILDIVAAKLEAFPVQFRAGAIESAVKEASVSNGVTPRDFDTWLDTPDGQDSLMAEMLLPDLPGVTAKIVRELFGDMPQVMYRQLIIQASGMADAKNS